MGSKSPYFLDAIYHDAMALLVEARDYAQSAVTGGGQGASADPFVACREAFRLTTRLTQVVSWLLVRKAVFNGELTAAQAAEPARRLGAREICYDDSAQGHPAVPAPLDDLLVRSRHLYMRISRLDEQCRRSQGISPQPRFAAVAMPSAPDPI